MATSAINATATIRRVESPFPDMRHDTVAASAIAAMNAAGTSQSASRAMPMTRAIGTCSQSTASNILLAVSRRITRSSRSKVIPQLPKCRS